jgi:hypothetical protein
MRAVTAPGLSVMGTWPPAGSVSRRVPSRRRFDPVGERLGAAEPRQVDGDDVEKLGERGHHRVPGVARQPEGVQQHQGGAGARAAEGEPGHLVVLLPGSGCRPSST